MTLQQTSAPAVRRPAKRRDKQRLWQEVAMIAPAVLLLATFLITPFLLSFWTAMTNQPLVPRPTPVRFVGMANFVRILTDDLFWTSLWNVTRFTVWVLPVQCGFAFLTALILNQKMPLRGLFRGMFFLPAITSMVVVCVIWGTLFQYPSGPLNQIVGFVSGGRIQPIDWMGNPDWAMFSIVLLSAWQAYGFQMIIYLAGLQGISEELYDAARIDGAGDWRILWQIVAPMSRGIIATLAIITVVTHWNNFMWPLIITTGRDWQVITVATANLQSQYNANWTLVMAATTVAMAPLLVVFAIFQRTIVNSISLTGFK